jgi:hypothetical protein
MIGLYVNVIGTDCTNGGATSGKRNAVVINFDGPFRPCADSPALYVVEDEGVTGRRAVSRSGEVHRVKAVPLDEDGVPRLGGMFGGHWITTSDARFEYETPIPVHDRFETAEEQMGMT